MNYKTATSLKGFDVIGQLLAPVISFILSGHLHAGWTSLLVWVGAWQLVSAFIHLMILEDRVRWKSRYRRGYLISVLVLIVAGFLCAALPGGMILIFLMLLALAGPVLALVYFGISFSEWQDLKRLARDRASIRDQKTLQP